MKKQWSAFGAAVLAGMFFLGCAPQNATVEASTAQAQAMLEATPTAEGNQAGAMEANEATDEPPDSLRPISAAPTAVPDETDGTKPIDPWTYQRLLGRGMDVDWSKTARGRKWYNAKAAQDLSEAGVSHVRIRISEEAEEELLLGLDQQIADCLEYRIMPILAYQADAFKKNPNAENAEQVIDWWATVSERYAKASYFVAFDLMIEATDQLNQDSAPLNDLYERVVSTIRETNPNRILIISPRLRSDAACLSELRIPSQNNGYLMAEWHFYAAGPSRTNRRKLWTTGTEEERALIQEKIDFALAWQETTGIPTWVGAWMPGNYNDGNDYSIGEQVEFAQYMTQRLTKAKLPFAVNSDSKFYDREKNRWIAEMEPLIRCIFQS